MKIESGSKWQLDYDMFLLLFRSNLLVKKNALAQENCIISYRLYFCSSRDFK